MSNDKINVDFSSSGPKLTVIGDNDPGTINIGASLGGNKICKFWTGC